MTLSLQTQASERRDGRCADCGQFIAADVSHFHGPKSKFRGAPRPHLWVEGGGMVTRCDDPARARDLIVRRYASRAGLSQPDDAADLADLFPVEKARVERGRIVPCDCGDCVWVWMPLTVGAVGPGVTTAVVWYGTW